MPIYAYRCSACGRAKDVLQKMSDPLLTVCPFCGEPTFVKQVTAAGFQLKGSGWYVTDFRGDSKAPKAADGVGAQDGAKSDGASADGKSGEGKPAESKAADGKTGDGKVATQGKAGGDSSPGTAPAKGDGGGSAAASPASSSSPLPASGGGSGSASK